MNEAIFIWVYLSVGNIVGVLNFVLSISTVFFLVAVLFSPIIVEDSDLESFSDFVCVIKNHIPIKTIILALLIVVLYPSKEDMKYIIGGSIAINGVQAADDIKGAKELPENLINAMNHFLKETQKEQ
jgi:hypothetical protein